MNINLATAVLALVQNVADKEAQDELLDLLEDWIARSETKLDDRFALPMIRAYRALAGVPDGDD